MNDDKFNKLKKEFMDKWQYLNKRLAYPYEYFNCIDDYYQKPVNDLKKEDFSSKLKKKCPMDEEIERTKEIIKLFNIENENFVKVFVKEFNNIALYCVSLSGYTCQCVLKYTDINLQTLQD